jgi:DNA-binding IclR family transcriptional regulator
VQYVPSHAKGIVTGSAAGALGRPRAEGADFLAAHHDVAHTLSDLGRGVAVNTSSLYSVLNVLEAGGYVTRDPRTKAYRLGFSTIAVGHAALSQHPVIQRAREHTAELARGLRLECLAGAIVGAEVVIIAEAGSPEMMQFRPRIGQRLPNSPAMSALAAAYAEEDEVEAWLDRLGPGVGEEARASYRNAAAAVRARGYEVGLETVTRQRIGAVLAELQREPHDRRLKRSLTELVAQLAAEDHKLLDPEPKLTHPVNNIQAPIFDEHNRCIAGITLLGFERPLAARDIERYSRALLAATDDVTRSTGGRPPAEA